MSLVKKKYRDWNISFRAEHMFETKKDCNVSWRRWRTDGWSCSQLQSIFNIHRLVNLSSYNIYIYGTIRYDYSFLANCNWKKKWESKILFKVRGVKENLDHTSQTHYFRSLGKQYIYSLKCIVFIKLWNYLRSVPKLINTFYQSD